MLKIITSAEGNLSCAYAGEPNETVNTEHYASKVPEVTLGFWIIKILATTLRETGGDTVTMTWDLGYLTGTAIFLTALLVLVVIQIAAKKFHPFLYWSTIVASTTAGTTMADFATSHHRQALL